MITQAQLSDAAFWEETICPQCGATEGEPFYACAECDIGLVLPAVAIQALLASVEPADVGDTNE